MSSVFATISGSVWLDKKRIGMSIFLENLLGRLGSIYTATQVYIHEYEAKVPLIEAYTYRFLAGGHYHHFVACALEYSAGE